MYHKFLLNVYNLCVLLLLLINVGWVVSFVTDPISNETRREREVTKLENYNYTDIIRYLITAI